MTYALIITVAVAALLLTLISGAALVIRRAAEASRRGEAPFGRWRWYPSQWGWLLVLLLPVAALVLWRAFPVVLLLPIIVPFFWRLRAGGGPFGSRHRQARRRRPSSNGHHEGADRTIEGSYHALDDDEHSGAGPGA